MLLVHSLSLGRAQDVKRRPRLIVVINELGHHLPGFPFPRLTHLHEVVVEVFVIFDVFLTSTPRPETKKIGCHHHALTLKSNLTISASFRTCVSSTWYIWSIKHVQFDLQFLFYIDISTISSVKNTSSDKFMFDAVMWILFFKLPVLYFNQCFFRLLWNH